MKSFNIDRTLSKILHTSSAKKTPPTLPVGLNNLSAFNFPKFSMMRSGGKITEQYLQQKNIQLRGTPKEKKVLLHHFSRRPEFIQKASGTSKVPTQIMFGDKYDKNNQFSTQSELGEHSLGEYIPIGQKGGGSIGLSRVAFLENQKQKNLGVRRPFIPRNLPTTLAHEIEHNYRDRNVVSLNKLYSEQYEKEHPIKSKKEKKVEELLALQESLRVPQYKRSAFVPVEQRLDAYRETMENPQSGGKITEDYLRKRHIIVQGTPHERRQFVHIFQKRPELIRRQGPSPQNKLRISTKPKNEIPSFLGYYTREPRVIVIRQDVMEGKYSQHGTGTPESVMTHEVEHAYLHGGEEEKARYAAIQPRQSRMIVPEKQRMEAYRQTMESTVNDTVLKQQPRHFTPIVKEKMKGQGWFTSREIYPEYLKFRKENLGRDEFTEEKQKFIRNDLSTSLKTLTEKEVLDRKPNPERKGQFLYRVSKSGGYLPRSGGHRFKQVTRTPYGVTYTNPEGTQIYFPNVTHPRGITPGRDFYWPQTDDVAYVLEDLPPQLTKKLQVVVTTPKQYHLQQTVEEMQYQEEKRIRDNERRENYKERFGIYPPEEKKSRIEKRLFGYKSPEKVYKEKMQEFEVDKKTIKGRVGTQYGGERKMDRIGNIIYVFPQHIKDFKDLRGVMVHEIGHHEVDKIPHKELQKTIFYEDYYDNKGKIKSWFDRKTTSPTNYGGRYPWEDTAETFTVQQKATEPEETSQYDREKIKIIKATYGPGTPEYNERINVFKKFGVETETYPTTREITYKDEEKNIHKATDVEPRSGGKFAHQYSFSDVGRKDIKTVLMPPDRFLSETMKQIELQSPNEPQFLSLKEYEEKLLHPRNIEYLKKRIPSEAEEVAIPFLTYDKWGRPTGHEGRHTSVAARQLGMEKIPVTIERRRNAREWEKEPLTVHTEQGFSKTWQPIESFEEYTEQPVPPEYVYPSKIDYDKPWIAKQLEEEKENVQKMEESSSNSK